MEPKLTEAEVLYTDPVWHPATICYEPLRTAEISVSRSGAKFVRLLWSHTCQHKTRPTGRSPVSTVSDLTTLGLARPGDG
jgi:hypothetical protein